MSIGPIWGSKCWRTLTIIVGIVLLAWGILTMITAYVSGQELWWYQSTIVFYAIALFGLVLLIKEGVDAFNNVMRYGRHPDKSEWESIGDSPRTEPVRTYHEPE